jgi:hypothetical protein
MSAEDRMVKTDPTKCAAFGCPMHGALTSSTVGTDQWFCWLHFGKEAVHWHAVTMELNRLAWLVGSIQDMRRNFTTPEWPDTYRLALQAIRANQRSDLEILETEAVKDWFRRLDNELGRAVAAIVTAPTKQARAELKEAANKDTWKRVAIETPH